MSTYPDYLEMIRYWNENGESERAHTVGDLAEQLRINGLDDMDVMVHCSYKAIRPVKGGPRAVVEAFRAAVGPRGCVLFPTYDFQTWSESHYWDRGETPSRMGVITEVARTVLHRTRHPMLSYAVSNGAAYMRDWENSHGPDSLFEEFAKRDGVLVSIGALEPVNPGFAENNVGFTFLHHAEMMAMDEGARVSHRRYKSFGGLYVDLDRSTTVRTYTASVRQPGYRTAVSPAMKEMEDEGIVQRIRFGNSWTHIARARDVQRWVLENVESRPELLREVV